jgi:hypothetical protein
MRRALVQSGEITNYIMIHWTQVIGFLTENGEMEALVALNCLDIARLNEIMVISTIFIKCVEGNSISYVDVFLMLQKPMVNLRPLLASKHAETRMQTVSGRFSRTTDMNIISVCCLVTRAGRNITALLSDQAHSL